MLILGTAPTYMRSCVCRPSLHLYIHKVPSHQSAWSGPLGDDTTTMQENNQRHACMHVRICVHLGMQNEMFCLLEAEGLSEFSTILLAACMHACILYSFHPFPRQLMMQCHIYIYYWWVVPIPSLMLPPTGTTPFHLSINHLL